MEHGCHVAPKWWNLISLDTLLVLVKNLKLHYREIQHALKEFCQWHPH